MSIKGLYNLTYTAVLLVMGVFTSSALAAPPAGWAPLLEPGELASLLDSNTHVRLIQVTGDFADGHIPGSVHAPYAEFRGPQNSPGTLPPLQDLTALVQRLGIDATTPVVVVHQGANPADMGTATRVYWTLKSLGVEHLAVLNGGLAAWQAQQLPTSTQASEVTATNFQPEWQQTWQIHADDIERMLEQDDAQIIDARPAAFFEGQQATAVRAGTIPGASNISFESLFDNNSMKSSEELNSILSSAALNSAATTVSFCNSGQLGSINWFVMSELAGMSDVKLYAESMMEWAASERPMANQP